jgi:hypothetical protein
MTSSDLLTLFRSEMSDTAAPYLWSDEDVFGYMDDAQTMYCRKTDGILDASTDAVTKIAVVPGSDRIALHAKIKRIRALTREDTGRDLDVINRDDMVQRRWYFDGTVGEVKALVIGQEAHKARVYPTSNETVNLRLEVLRLPLLAITTDGDQAFEIDAEHHRHLLLWMKHLAYMKQDAETFDRTKAMEFEGKALAYFAQVKEEERRKAFKVRTVAYGGI